jgi:hypothetical protein
MLPLAASYLDHWTSMSSRDPPIRQKSYTSMVPLP